MFPLSTQKEMKAEKKWLCVCFIDLKLTSAYLSSFQGTGICLSLEAMRASG